MEGRTTSTARLERLAALCVQELGNRGLSGTRAEAAVEGIGREKQWDVVWRHAGKVRLAISLKSVLRNISGSVPNRLDDLMGEVANVQLFSPEIVIGYVMVFDRSHDSWSKRHGSTWLEFLRSRLETLSGRNAPSWAIGTIEAHVLAEVDFSLSSSLQSAPGAFDDFFDALAGHVRFRNPAAVD